MKESQMDSIKLIVIGVVVVAITGLVATLINNKTKISNIETKLEIISKSNTKLQDGYEDLKIRQERLNIDEINALSQRLQNQLGVLEKTKNEQKRIIENIEQQQVKFNKITSLFDNTSVGLDKRINLIDSKVKEIENILLNSPEKEKFDDKKYHSLVSKIREIEQQIKNLDSIKNAEKDASKKSQLKPVKKSKAVSATRSIEAESFIFNLDKCSQSGSSVTCYMTFTNTGDDRELELKRRSRVFDNYGNEYQANQVCIANESKMTDVNYFFPSTTIKIPEFYHGC